MLGTERKPDRESAPKHGAARNVGSQLAALPILWGALLAAVLVYVGVGMAGVGADEAAPEIAFLPGLLGLLALGSAALAHFFWRRRRSEPASELTGAGESSPAPAQRALAFSVVAWSFDESIALFGLVLALLGFATGTWSVFMGFALVMMLLHRPGG